MRVLYYQEEPIVPAAVEVAVFVPVAVEVAEMS
jgi:hypothetical protein